MAFFVKVYDKNPNISVINKVVEVLKKGGLIIYPTDTVYGLGCDITNAKAWDYDYFFHSKKFNVSYPPSL